MKRSSSFQALRFGVIAKSRARDGRCVSGMGGKCNASIATAVKSYSSDQSISIMYSIWSSRHKSLSLEAAQM